MLTYKILELILNYLNTANEGEGAEGSRMLGAIKGCAQEECGQRKTHRIERQTTGKTSHIQSRTLN